MAGLCCVLKVNVDDVEVIVANFRATFTNMTPVHPKLLGNGQLAALEVKGVKPRRNVIFYCSGKVVVNNIPAADIEKVASPDELGHLEVLDTTVT